MQRCRKAKNIKVLFIETTQSLMTMFGNHVRLIIKSIFGEVKDEEH